MILEELSLCLKGSCDGFVGLDIALASVHDWHVSKSQGDDSSSQNVDNISALVPTITSVNELECGRYLMYTHMRSTLVRTPIVLVPSGSTSRAIFNPSELAKSVLAAVTAKMIHDGLVIYFINISLICLSISLGWSPTGTFVNPGRSTNVSVRTLGE